ncbi:MAG TPA: hypothetical protein PKA63_06220 [Oligoflexia bacterium]|nr:hypothetical protein [Oligoflexia bacterium]HMP48245.1 hypothetical protein [Oligoflexia bacterium]
MIHNKTLFNLYSVLILLAFFLACDNDKSSSNPSLSAPRGIECGGGIGYNCPINMYCDFGSECGGIDKTGICKRIPEDCSLEEDTVCGCDEKEYQNTCIANTLSVTIKNKGECIKAPVFVD